MICRFLEQARRTMPHAVVSIAEMFTEYMQILHENRGVTRPDKDIKLFSSLSRHYNLIIRQLALPSSTLPMKSMNFNWAAQRLLLQRANEFKPPLIIDQPSYRAVMRVLAASAKSEGESRFANLMARTWPPWRQEQDGMDAARPLERDLSRVMGVINQMKRAGYSNDVRDSTVGIMGGREPDGTPTVQTRAIIPGRRMNTMAFNMDTMAADGRDNNAYNRNMWAARIRATRDTREAWSAFLSAEELPTGAHLLAYYAMFEKLIFEKARQNRPEAPQPFGDGKEVAPALDANLSEEERVRSTPPDIDGLYDRMIASGLRPSGRLLVLLVRHARTIDDGIKYLLDSDVNMHGRAVLIGQKSYDEQLAQRNLKKIPEDLFAAFIRLLGRFAHRRITLSIADAQISTSNPEQLLETDALTSRRPSKRLNPLFHAFELSRLRHKMSRFAWYALFDALARRDVIIDAAITKQPLNDILSWKILRAALSDSESAGMELDPPGFRIVCVGLEKAYQASKEGSEDEAATLSEAPKLLKRLFARLSQSEEGPIGHVPRLLHVFEGAHLHAYLRVLGRMGEWTEMLRVLEWMVQHETELHANSKLARNGEKMLRTAVVSIAVFLKDETLLEKARKFLEGAETFGDWPSEEELEQYHYRVIKRLPLESN
jgi:hypothetical protein